MNTADMLSVTGKAVGALWRFVARVQSCVAQHSSRMDRDQRRLHGFAWVATVAEALAQLHEWDARAHVAGSLGEGERQLIRVAFGEHLAQLLGGLPMSQNEFVRPADLGATSAAEELADDPAVARLLGQGTVPGARAALAAAIGEDWCPADSLQDDMLDAVREQFRRFGRERIAPHAHAWHLRDALIPDEVIGQMADMGAFGVCIDPRYGGLGLGKLPMCIVSEELSRAWIAAGSLGTRPEIAGELIGTSGTDPQKETWLPGIASELALPTAVFTQPEAGSDRASLRTRAVRDDAGAWRITDALRHRGGHGEALRRTRVLDQRGCGPADPWRERLCARVGDQPCPLRCAYPEHRRRRGGNPDSGDRALPAGLDAIMIRVRRESQRPDQTGLRFSATARGLSWKSSDAIRASTFG